MIIKQLGPLISHSCFGFESKHRYFKKLAKKQNFINLPKSLAERCQLQECSNIFDSNEGTSSHPLFSSEKEFGVLGTVPETDKRYLVLKNFHKCSWVTVYGTKFGKEGVIVCGIEDSIMLPIFAIIKTNLGYQRFYLL